MRQYLMDGDFFSGSTLATNLTKLVLKYVNLCDDRAKTNRLCCSVMLTLSSIIHLGKSGFPSKPITNDDHDRIFVCLKTLSDRSPEVVEVFVNSCRNALARMLDAHQAEEQQQLKDKRFKSVKVQPDDPISFSQLSNGKDNILGENLFETSLNQALAGTKSAYFILYLDKRFSVQFCFCRHFHHGHVVAEQQTEQGDPVDWFLGPRVRRGLCARQPVRHRAGRADCQPDQRHAAELHARVGHAGRSKARRATAAGSFGAARFLQHQGQRQGVLDGERHYFRQHW